MHHSLSPLNIPAPKCIVCDQGGSALLYRRAYGVGDNPSLLFAPKWSTQTKKRLLQLASVLAAREDMGGPSSIFNNVYFPHRFSPSSQWKRFSLCSDEDRRLRCHPEDLNWIE